MLHTPASFIPLITRQEHDDPLTFLFHQGKLLLREADLAVPGLGTVSSMDVDPSRLQPVGLLDGRYVQTAWLDGDAAPPGYAWQTLRSALWTLDAPLAGVAGRAAQVAEWARTHRFCGACGSATSQARSERCFTCTVCGHMAYPRISPAMMVLIRKGDAYLMAMHVNSPSKRFTPLAGFLEAGESIEEAVHREVYEEVGLKVSNLRYFGSQAWPFPHSLMIAFTADYESGEIRVDPNELSEARWFGPDDEWPERVPHISVSSVLVDAHRPPGR
ncbi:NAD(+) diphosphatase [Massilia terrae]|uniref:NAD(+) diphosphatase n=1 Tax=Massilia terrae TaxID=1811224 RepID=A0ABT2D3K5_9BURK|nr:NAD(+) diphosphatase [Massilia terrae]MCS0659975.1 NAD(+) diphosphatase [Massilia terrae]